MSFTVFKLAMYNNTLFHFILVLTCVEIKAATIDTGYFWQITDIHYDTNYSQHGNPDYSCHENASGPVYNIGEYGNYRCDIPWLLTTSAVAAMKKFHPNPDFIIWTGDTIPHVPVEELSLKNILSVIGKVTDLLVDTFPSTAIYPSMGNHDSMPPDQLPPGHSTYYEQILEASHWNRMLHQESLNTFKKGGFYATSVMPGLRVISLNSVLWYLDNKLVVNITSDPADQFKWFETELIDARKHNEKVLVIGHVPPGITAANMQQSFYPRFNKRYLSIVNEYWDVITTQIFAHEHKDSFHVFYKNDTPISVALMTPAVTPWFTSNNPTVRLYHYEKTTGNILDIYQYYLNLSAANVHQQADWLKEYQATKDYGIADISAKSMDKLLTSFMDDNSDNFRKFYLYNSASYDTGVICDAPCKHKYICSVKFVDYDAYNSCVATSQLHKLNKELFFSRNNMTAFVNSTRLQKPTPEETSVLDRVHHHHQHDRHYELPVSQHMYFILYASVIVVLVLFFFVTICCWLCRQKTVMAYPRYVLIT